MANLARSGRLRRASDDAYRDLDIGLARVGPLGATPGLSRLVAVRFSDLAASPDRAIWAIRWEVTGPGGTLFPALDADITLTPADDGASTMLVLSGVYRPPLGGLGAALDRAIMRGVAQATFRSFTHHIAAAVAHPEAPREAGYARILRGSVPWTDPATP